LDQIRDYFGEEIAFYFLFLDVLARATLLLTIPSCACFVWWLLTSSPETPSFTLSFINMLWFRCFVLRWRQTQREHANKWGVADVKDCTLKKLRNPRFTGEYMCAPENENIRTLQKDRCKVLLGRVLSVVCSLLFLVVLLLLLGLEHLVFYRSVVFVQSLDGALAGQRSLLERGLCCALGIITGVQIKAVDLGG